MSEIVSVSKKEYEQIKQKYPEARRRYNGEYLDAYFRDVVKTVYNKDDNRKQHSDHPAMWHEHCLELIRVEGELVWQEGWIPVCCSG